MHAKPLRRDSQFPQPGHQVLLRLVALHPVTLGAKQLEVFDVILTTAALRNDVIHLQYSEGEFDAASVAPSLLLAKEDVLVLAVMHRRV